MSAFELQAFADAFPREDDVVLCDPSDKKAYQSNILNWGDHFSIYCSLHCLGNEPSGDLFRLHKRYLSPAANAANQDVPYEDKVIRVYRANGRFDVELVDFQQDINYVWVPRQLFSVHALASMGIEKSAAAAIIAKWEQSEDMRHPDMPSRQWLFLRFVTAACISKGAKDAGRQDDDRTWWKCLRRCQLDDLNVIRIMVPMYREKRLMHSAHYWARQVIEMRFRALQEIQRTSELRNSSPYATHFDPNLPFTPDDPQHPNHPQPCYCVECPWARPSPQNPVGTIRKFPYRHPEYTATTWTPELARQLRQSEIPTARNHRDTVTVFKAVEEAKLHGFWTSGVTAYNHGGDAHVFQLLEEIDYDDHLDTTPKIFFHQSLAAAEHDAAYLKFLGNRLTQVVILSVEISREALKRLERHDPQSERLDWSVDAAADAVNVQDGPAPVQSGPKLKPYYQDVARYTPYLGPGPANLEYECGFGLCATVLATPLTVQDLGGMEHPAWVPNKEDEDEDEAMDVENLFTLLLNMDVADYTANPGQLSLHIS